MFPPRRGRTLQDEPHFSEEAVKWPRALLFLVFTAAQETHGHPRPWLRQDPQAR